MTERNADVSKTLTEKWKKGELPSGYYYVKNEFGNIFPSDYSEDYDYIGDTVIKDFFTEVSEIKEVLEPVPSYEQWQEYKDANDSMFDTKKMLNKDNYKLEKENTKLKELLNKFAEANQSLRKQIDEEKAKNRIDYYNGSPMDFLDECERDRKKNKIYKNWINNIREELIISDLRRTEEGNKFIVNLLAKINQVLGEE